ncbi:MAG TPA: hypothetical protein VG407_04485 [Caulobacteraceae bacterium]|jgi:hypothetical protein|nr:hypothetical protein [Caulobacteraceae bacterium]
MRLAVRLAALLAPVLCLGAGSPPEPAPAGAQAQTAQIELLRNPDIDASFGGAREILWLAKDTSCMGKFGAKNVGAFGWLYGNNKGLVAIPAGKVAYLWMLEDEPVDYRRRRSCENAASFMPEAGHSYDAQQSTTETSCSLSVVDRATKLPPPTYHPFSPKIFCQPKN